MIREIIRQTPVWVWLVLAVLLVLGFLQSRPRKVPPVVALILPAIMTGLSLYSVISLSPHIAGFTGWGAGLVAAAILNGLVFRSPRGVRRDAGANRLALLGSWLPLALMMAIFATQFVVGVTTAISPATAVAPGFNVAITVLLGFCAGMFLSRAWFTVRAKTA